MNEVDVTELFQEGMKWLIDQYENGVLVSELDSKKIIYMNQVCYEMFQVSKEIDLSNYTCHQIIHGLDEVCEFCPNVSLSENKYYAWECKSKNDGRSFSLQNKIINWNWKNCHMHIVIDMSSKSEMEAILDEKINVENTLLDCMNAISFHSDYEPDTALNEMLGTVGEFYQADRVSIFTYNMKQKQIATMWEWCGEDIPSYIQDGDVAELLHGGDRPFFTTSLPTIIHDTQKIRELFPAKYKWMKARGLRAVYMVPLLQEEEPFGCVCVENPVLSVDNYSLLNTLSLFICNQVLYSDMREKRIYDIYHDVLTGLENRNSYARWLKEQEECPADVVGVAVANINRLSEINTKFGFEFGDTVIKQVARVLCERYKDDYLFRFEGDEFVIICLNRSYREFLISIHAVKGKLVKKTPRGVVFGAAWSEDKERDMNRLIWEANQSMIANKQRVHEQKEVVSRYTNTELLDDLQREIKEGRYHVFLQPKMDFRKGKLEGIEALSRYVSEEGKVVSPDKYIPTFEKTGLIRYIDFYMLDQICRTLDAWRARGIPLCPVSLNFSRVTIREDYIAKQIAEIVDRYNIPHEYILIEITESAGDMEREVFTSIGQRLIARGFGISLDDFCSQYSCASLLAALPFREVKIDRSMLIKITEDEKMRSLCSGVISICHHFGYCVVAEGVETQEQVDILIGTKCDLIQGYFYDRPISVMAFEQKYFC